VGEQGTLYYRGHAPSGMQAYFVTAGSSRGGGRMLVVGSIAAAATYFIGSLLGASVS